MTPMEGSTPIIKYQLTDDEFAENEVGTARGTRGRAKRGARSLDRASRHDTDV